MPLSFRNALSYLIIPWERCHPIAPIFAILQYFNGCAENTSIKQSQHQTLSWFIIYREQSWQVRQQSKISFSLVITSASDKSQYPRYNVGAFFLLVSSKFKMKDFVLCAKLKQNWLPHVPKCSLPPVLHIPIVLKTDRTTCPHEYETMIHEGSDKNKLLNSGKL